MRTAFEVSSRQHWTVTFSSTRAADCRPGLVLLCARKYGA
jgi:hypothetical protein